MKRIAKLSAAVFTGAVVVTCLPSTAYAATSAPSCVKRVSGSTGGMPNGAKVTVTNNCTTSKRLKVIFTNAHDSECFSLAPGKSATRTSNIAYPFSHYDKTVLC